MKVRKAVITAAGWGTRLLPITKAQPKEMLPLLNKPLIHYSVEEAVSCGAEFIVIVTAMGKKAIEDYFDRHFELEYLLEKKGETRLLEEVRRLSSLADIGYTRQKELLGLGHAVLTAQNMIGNEPFLLLLPDDVFEQSDRVLQEMAQIYYGNKGSVVAVKRVPGEEVSRYGIVDCKKVSDRLYRVTDLVEKPDSSDAPSDLAIMGRYVLDPQIFEVLRDTPPGRNGEIQLTDALKGLLRQQPLYAYEFEGERWDAGTLEGWLETTVAMALRDPVIGPRFRGYIRTLAREVDELVSG